MTQIRLEAGDDHIQRLARENDPVRGVIELIWNSLDANASAVNLTLHRNQADGVTGVEIVDDGHGMAPEALVSAFKLVGNSWKKTAQKSRDVGRPLHGRYGQGRLRAFALGSQVSWETVAMSAEGHRLRSVIHASSASRSDFTLSEPETTTEALGTRFTASGRQSLSSLDTDKALDRITATFAPYLIAHADIEIIYDGSKLQAADSIDVDTFYELLWEHAGIEQHGQLRIIEWTQVNERAIHLCDAEGVPVEVIETAQFSDFQYSAYVLWGEMSLHQNEWILAQLESTPSVIGGLLAEVERILQEHFEHRRSQRRRELVEEWKVGKVYPYEGEPATEEEKVERATFDVVATSIRRHIPKTQKQKRLTLGLLRDSIQRRPSDVSTLLDEYVGLPQEERVQLDRLLRRTGLSRVIKASSDVTNRLEFLRALELMVFDPEASMMVGERDHLHRILESELWVFGEQYNLMISERGLTAVLDRHREILGQFHADKSPVKLLDGRSGRLDLLLSVAASEYDRNRHLVVELKAPKITVGLKELTQIKSYAKAVAIDPRFASTTTEWDFWLVTSKMDDDVRQEANQANRERGLAFEPDLPNAPGAKVRVWVRDWGQIIEDARRRLDYFQQSLQHDPSLDDAREYLRRNHSDVIPKGFLIDDASEPEAPGIS